MGSKLFPTFGFRIITELSSPEDLPGLKLTSYPTNDRSIVVIRGNSKAILPKSYALGFGRTPSGSTILKQRLCNRAKRTIVRLTLTLLLRALAGVFSSSADFRTHDTSEKK